MNNSPTIRVNIPGLVMSEVDDREIVLHPEESGYIPSLGHKLKNATSRKRGSGVTYVVDLTREEALEFAEFCDDMILPNRDAEQPNTIRALVATSNRIERALRELDSTN